MRRTAVVSLPFQLVLSAQSVSATFSPRGLFLFCIFSLGTIGSPKSIHKGSISHHFWCQHRAAFAQILFDIFNGSIIWQKLATVQKLQSKICR
jgi:hypothetical protein